MGVLKTLKAFRKRLKGESTDSKRKDKKGVGSRPQKEISIVQDITWESCDKKEQDLRRSRASAQVEDWLNSPFSYSSIDHRRSMGKASERRNAVCNSTMPVFSEPVDQDTSLPPLPKHTTPSVPNVPPVPKGDTTLLSNSGTKTPQDSVVSPSSQKPSPASTIDLNALAQTEPEVTTSDQLPTDRPMAMPATTSTASINDEVGNINADKRLSIADICRMREMLQVSRSNSSSSEYSDDKEPAPTSHASHDFHPRSARHSSPPTLSSMNIPAPNVPQKVLSATDDLSRLMDPEESEGPFAVPSTPGESSTRASYVSFTEPTTTPTKSTREPKRASMPATSHRYDSAFSSPSRRKPTPSLTPAPYHRFSTPAPSSTYSTTHDKFLSLLGPSLPHENPKRYALRRRSLLASVHLAEHHLVEAPHTPRGSVIMERLNKLEEQIEVEEQRERRRQRAARASAAVASAAVSSDGNGVAVAMRASHIGGSREVRERKKPVMGVHCANDVRLGFQGAWSRGYSAMEEHPLKAKEKNKKEKKEKNDKKNKKDKKIKEEKRDKRSKDGDGGARK